MQLCGSKNSGCPLSIFTSKICEPRSGTQRTWSRRCSEQVAITPKRRSGAGRSGDERKPIYLSMMSETQRSEAERLSEVLLLRSRRRASGFRGGTLYFWRGGTKPHGSIIPSYSMCGRLMPPGGGSCLIAGMKRAKKFFRVS